MELEITWKRAARVWWSYLWRNLLAVLGAMVIGGLMGGAIGLAMGIAGASPTTVKIVTTPIGALLGLLISIVPVRLILGKDFGEFRLVLVANDTPSSPPVLPTEAPNLESPAPTREK